jgi:hypothetical protein
VGRTRTLILSYATCAALAACCAVVFAGDRQSEDASSAARFEAYRLSGDLQAQRRYAWGVVSRLDFLDKAERSLSRAWLGSDEIFAPASSGQSKSIAGKAGAHDGMAQSGEPQAIIITLYNDIASRHIRISKLHERAALDQLLVAGMIDPLIRENRTVPSFPSDAVVVLTAWWPIARDRTTAMPVWDPDLNPPLSGGNNYATWQRAVAVDRSNASGAIDIDVAGRRFRGARRANLEAFHYVIVDDAMAKRNRRDAHTHKAAVIALGRELRAGDYLALVAVHVMAKLAHSWVWATLWWHDEPGRGVFADDRPSTVRGAWRNYLLDAAFDAELPEAADGGPHICFNPWLEARFPDDGAGSGIVSNCVACHSRASYPAVSFLPVTRGEPNVLEDPAYAPGRLRTDFLWSLARQAR